MIKQKKIKPTFSVEVKEAMLAAYGYHCAMPDCSDLAEHFHHIVANTEVNNHNWPLYIQSPFNCYPICSTCHMNKPLPCKPSERLIQLFEEYLRSLVKLEKADLPIG